MGGRERSINDNLSINFPLISPDSNTIYWQLLHLINRKYRVTVAAIQSEYTSQLAILFGTQNSIVTMIGRVDCTQTSKCMC